MITLIDGGVFTISDELIFRGGIVDGIFAHGDGPLPALGLDGEMRSGWS